MTDIHQRASVIATVRQAFEAMRLLEKWLPSDGDAESDVRNAVFVARWAAVEATNAACAYLEAKEQEGASR